MGTRLFGAPHQVYFSGFHSSVGGGDEPDTESAQASNIPLHWMITKILQAPSCGIVFHQPALSAFLAAYSTSTVKLADGRVISASAQARILDSLWNFGSAKDTLSTGFWWLLELFPFRTNWQDPQTKVWHRSYRWVQMRAGSIGCDTSAQLHYSRP